MPNVALGSGGSISTYQWTYLGTTASNFRINGGPLLNPGSVIGSPYTTTDILINTTSPLATTGIIGFELVVTDVNGCTSEPVEIYIEVKPVPNAGTNGSFGPICETFGNINLFSLLGGTPDAGGVWTADPGNPTGGTLAGPNFNPAGSVGGTYLFTYTIDNGVCTPVSSTVTVQVQPNANAGTFDILADNDVCEDEPSFNLFTLLSGTAGVNYDAGGAWAELTSSGAGLNPSTGELDLTTAIPGNYTFRYTVNVGPTACPNPVDFEEVVLNIIAAPAPNPILGNAMPCVNTTANYALTTPVVMGVTRLWSLSGGGTITSGTTGSSISVSWGSTPGTYTVTCVSSRLGCETVNTFEVEVQAATALFSYQSASPDGYTIMFTDESTGGPFIWSWNFDDNGNVSSDQSPTYEFSGPGTYTVCLNIVANCGVSQYCTDITIPYNPQIVCDTIQLIQGYNLVSFDVHPSNTTVEDVFDPLITAGILQSVSTYDGSPMLFDPNLPPIFNDLHNIEDGFGYYVQVSQPATFILCGTPIDSTFKKDLDAGWNLTAYIPQSPQAVEDYFDALIVANNLEYASAYINNAPLIYDPDLPPVFNDLHTVENGFGYGVYVTNAVLGIDWLTSPAEEIEYRGPKDFEVKKTSVYDFIMGQSNILNPASGDKVYIAKKSGEIVGAMDIAPGGYLLTADVYGDEPGTEEIDGLIYGEELIFIYNDESIDIGITFHGRLDRIWVDLEFNSSTVSKADDQPTTEFAYKAFPNPTSEEVWVSYVAGGIKSVQLTVTNSLGQLVLSRRLTKVVTGTNLEKLDFSNLQPGVYYIKLVSDNGDVGVMPIQVIK
ncbi:MAG TPA: PKD domain-containing protein [Flavilitoribacter sp.]|nr:PKD domain-containing protein [Flavilitoribacter sp.]